MLNVLTRIATFIALFIIFSAAIWWIARDSFGFDYGQSTSVLAIGFLVLVFKELVDAASNYFRDL